MKRDRYKLLDAMNAEPFNALGKYLHDMRISRNYSLRGLAEKIGAAPASLVGVERGAAPSILILTGYILYAGADENTIDRILRGVHPVYKCRRIRLYGNMASYEQKAFDGAKEGIYADVTEGLLIEKAKEEANDEI